MRARCEPVTASSLEGLVDSLDAAVIGLDESLRLRFANDPAENLLGRSRARLEGLTLNGLSAIGARLAAVATRVLESGSSVHELVEHRGVHLPVAASPWWAQGQTCGVVLMVGGAAVEVTEAPTDVAALAAGLAHEIRNPLAALRGAVELLSADVARGLPAEPAYLSLMLKEAGRMDALVGRILDLGRPPTLNLKPLRVSELLHELAVEARALAAASGDTVRIEERYDPALPTLTADETRLHEALLNLVKNAVEATAARGGTVQLIARVASERRRTSTDGRARPLVQISVTDDGPGFSGHASRLFTPFFTTKSTGTGLGLVLARQAVEAHGGVLRLRENQHGPGVEAVLLIPMGADDV